MPPSVFSNYCILCRRKVPAAQFLLHWFTIHNCFDEGRIHAVTRSFLHVHPEELEHVQSADTGFLQDCVNRKAAGNGGIDTKPNSKRCEGKGCVEETVPSSPDEKASGDSQVAAATIHATADVAVKEEPMDPLGDIDEGTHHLDESVTDGTDMEVGNKFSSFQEFRATFQQFCGERFTHVCVRRSEKNHEKFKECFPIKRIQYICIHYGAPRKGNVNQIRPNQAYAGRYCPFELCLRFVEKRGCYVITKLVAEHRNHVTDATSFQYESQGRRLSSEEILKYGNLIVNFSVPKKVVKQIIKKETGKDLSTQDLANLEKRVRGNVNKQLKRLVSTNDTEPNPS